MIGILFLNFLLRLPSLASPIIDVDESQFALYANALLDGGLPYISSVDTKPLGIYYYFASIFWLFGKNNMFAVHMVTILWVWATSVICLLISKEIFDKRAGILAALFYTIFSTAYTPKIISTSIVIIMMLPLTASIYFLVRWDKEKKFGFIWLSGFLFALSCMFKYQAGVNLMAAMIYLLLMIPLFKGISQFKEGFRGFFHFILSAGLAISIYLIAIAASGIWNDFYLWSIQGSSSYAQSAMTATTYLKRLLIRGGSFVGATLLIWFFAVKESTKRFETTTPYLILIWLLCSTFAVAIGGRFYGHYFLQLLPPLCILASSGAVKFMDWLNDKSTPIGWRKAAYTLFLTGLLIPPLGAYSMRLLGNSFHKKFDEDVPSKYIEIAKLVCDKTDSTDSIFVWGFASPIYFFSDRKPASRFIWSDWQSGRISGSYNHSKEIPFDDIAWKLLMKDLEKNMPKYIIDTSPGNHHEYGKYPIKNFPLIDNFVSKNYELEKNELGCDFYRLRGNR